MHAVDDRVFYLVISKQLPSTNGKSTNVDIKIILEDIRRTAEHASDIAEAAMTKLSEK